MIPPPASMYFLLVPPFVAVFSATHKTFDFKGIENVLAVNQKSTNGRFCNNNLPLTNVSQKRLLKRKGLTLHP